MVKNIHTNNFASKAFKPNNKDVIHFIGIGGIGFSGLALILHQLGYKTQGSDLIKNYNIDRLQKHNIPIFIGHDNANVLNATLVIISAVIKETNQELEKAKQLNLPTYTKADILEFLINLCSYSSLANAEQKAQSNLTNIGQKLQSIAITGAHGKTTTTCMLEAIFSGANKVSLFFAGGIVKKLNINAYVNNIFSNSFCDNNTLSNSTSDNNISNRLTYANSLQDDNSNNFAIIEADESDNTCFNVKPNILIITNIDKEHLDFYNSFDILLQKFKNIFSDSVNYQSCKYEQENNLCKLTQYKQEKNLKHVYQNLIICLDDLHLANIYNELIASEKNLNHIFTYGIENENNDIIAKNIIYQNNEMVFDIIIQKSFFNKMHLKNKKMLDNINFYQNAQFKMQLIGKHNVLNALACIAAAILAKISINITKMQLLSFEGTKRRFNLICKHNNVDIIDDYAHHPTEIKATIEAAKQKYKNIAIVVEIHKYSRLYELYDEFIDALLEVAHAIFIPIHTAGELNLHNIDHNNLSKSLNEIHLQKNNGHICKTIEINKTFHLIGQDIIQDAINFNAKLDCILFMGAGSNITQLANSYI